MAALPRRLAEEYADRMPATVVKPGKDGIAKQIFLGTREADESVDYLCAFVELVRQSGLPPPPPPPPPPSLPRTRR